MTDAKRIGNTPIISKPEITRPRLTKCFPHILTTETFAFLFDLEPFEFGLIHFFAGGAHPR